MQNNLGNVCGHAAGLGRWESKTAHYLLLPLPVGSGSKGPGTSERSYMRLSVVVRLP